MDWKAFITAFTTIFLAELGDKTQLATLAYAAKSSRPVSVFLGAGLALLASTALAVAIGTIFNKTIPTAIISKIAGGIFVIIGVLLFIGRL